MEKSFLQVMRIVRKLPLSDYAPEYGDLSLAVWVNPSRKALQARIEQAERGQVLSAELDELRTSEQPDIARLTTILEELKGVGESSLEWMSEILSQGSEETRVSLAELNEFIGQCEEFDLRLYPWISTRVWEMISEHRQAKKQT